MLAGDFELAALLLDLPEEPGVLDRQRRLGGERLKQFDRFWRELAGRLAIHCQGADQVILPDQRYRHDRAIPSLDERVADRARIGAHGDVRHLDRVTIVSRTTSTSSVELRARLTSPSAFSSPTDRVRSCVLAWSSRTSRAFSIAMAAWSAKVSSSA